MKELKSEDYCSIEYDSDSHILNMRFIGDMKDSQYKDIWRSSVQYAYEYGIEKIIIDQTEIGSVPFMARAWVITSMYSKIKRDLSPDLVASVLSSKDASHRSGMQYLVKGFQKISGYEIGFHKSLDEAIEWLNSKKE
ncbi:MAG: hypothetical protein ACPGJS_01550 [Flammeovirgaceae bacterium]